MTFKESLSIYFGNTEDAWSSSDESEDHREVNVYLEEALVVAEWKKINKGEMPREHHSW